jgi:hypothetical protein
MLRQSGRVDLSVGLNFLSLSRLDGSLKKSEETYGMSFPVTSVIRQSRKHALFVRLCRGQNVQSRSYASYASLYCQ